MKWRKSPPELVEVFESVVPGPPAVSRKMFGYPAAFVNGNMFMGLHQEDMVLRLPEDSREKLLNVSGARLFEPMPGRPMKEYVVVPHNLLADRKKLAPWVNKALEYGSSLKPKSKSKPRPKAAKSATKSAKKKTGSGK